jgi:hypothetical protein
VTHNYPPFIQFFTEPSRNFDGFSAPVSFC